MMRNPEWQHVEWHGWHGAWSVVDAICGCCGADVDAFVPEGENVYCEACGAEAPIHEDGKSLAWVGAWVKVTA